MKLFFGLIILLSNFFIGYSQNWRPIQLGEKMNYSLNKVDSFATTIWVDSININSTDTIFYLNKEIQKVRKVFCGNLYAMSSSFLLSKIIFSNDGSYMLQNNQSHYYINSNTSLNNSWIFDSIKNITAKVIAVKDSAVFNSIDSVKNIKLSNGDTIIISKNHGYLKFPLFNTAHHHARLIGIEGRNLGFVTPYFNDIFNFQIGDVFEYQNTINEDGFGSMSDSTWKQYKITGKLLKKDTFSYVISVKQKRKYDSSYDLEHFTAYSKYIETIKYAKNDYLLLNKTINQFIGFNVICKYDKYKLIKIGFNQTFSTITKFYNNEGYYPGWSSDTLSSCNYYNNSDDCFYSNIEACYGHGVGLIKQIYSNGQYAKNPSSQLLGCIVSGVKMGSLSADTVFNIYTYRKIYLALNETYQLPSGKIVSQAGIYIDTLLTASRCDSIITTTIGISTDINSNFSKVQIFPNPINDILNVRIDNADLFDIEIWNMQGELLIKKVNVYQSTQINMRGFNKGLYFIKINNNLKNLRIKIIKN